MATATALRETGAGTDVWWLDLGGVNAYLVEDAGELVLVDAGTPRDAADVREGIRDAGYRVADVARVLVTHYDLDHVGALSKLDLDAPVYAGRADAEVLVGQRAPDWRNHKGLLQRASSPFVSPPDLPVRPVDDGDRVGNFTAYHTPGHSPGHTAFVAGESRLRTDAGESASAPESGTDAPSVAFLGDLVRESDGVLEPSPWLMSYDTREVRRSVRRLADRAPDFEVAAMGHGTPVTADGSRRFRELASRV